METAMFVHSQLTITAPGKDTARCILVLPAERKNLASPRWGRQLTNRLSRQAVLYLLPRSDAAPDADALDEAAQALRNSGTEIVAFGIGPGGTDALALARRSAVAHAIVVDPETNAPAIGPSENASPVTLLASTGFSDDGFDGAPAMFRTGLTRRELTGILLDNPQTAEALADAEPGDRTRIWSILREGRRKQPNYLIRLGDNALKAQKPDRAAWIARIALERFENHPSCLLLMSAISRQREDLAGARDWAQRAFDLNPKAPVATIKVAQAMISGGAREDAVAFLRDSPASHPAIDQMLVEALLKNGQTEAAHDALRQTLSRHPASPQLKKLAERVGTETAETTAPPSDDQPDDAAISKLSPPPGETPAPAETKPHKIGFFQRLFGGGR